MSISYLRGATEWALMVALIFGAGAIAQAQDEEKPDKSVVQIGRADKEDAVPNLPSAGSAGVPGQPQQPRLEYWIGLKGGDIPSDHPLRAQLDLPENQGLLVAEIMPNSPALKAGLKQNDILLKANKTDLHDMKDLIELVKTEGPKKGQITVEILRHGKHETIHLTPEKTPDDVQFGEGPGGPRVDFRNGLPGIPNEMFAPGGQMPFDFRNLGPGVIVGGGQGINLGNMPNGVSVSIQKENDKPVHITVSRGGQTWNIVGDDPESLKQLPDDLRPYVEQMLHGGGMRLHMPQFGASGPGGAGIGPGLDNGQMRDRLERMEKRLEEMQKRLMGPENAPADKSNDQHDESK